MLEISQTIQHSLVPILFTICVIAIIFLISTYLRLVDTRKQLKKESFYKTVSAQTIDDYEHQVKLQEATISEQSKRLSEANAKITEQSDAIAILKREVETWKNEVDKMNSKQNELLSIIADQSAKIESLTRHRNAKGQFLPKGEREAPVERDWTTATKDELLSEAKKRYPVGTKIVCLYGSGYNDIENDNFEHAGYMFMWHRTNDGHVGCIFDHVWAQIIKP